MSQSTGFPAPLAIEELVEARRKELEISRSELVVRAGFKNIAKGIRRLDELFEGDLSRPKVLIAGLPAALQIGSDTIGEALEKTRQQILKEELIELERRDAERRTNFRAHVIILTELARPQPIFIAALCQTHRFLRIEIDPNTPPGEYLAKALGAVRARLADTNFPGFGRARGFVINYSPDCGVRFDLDGIPREVLSSAYRLGQATLVLGNGRAIPNSVLTVPGSSGT